MNHFELLFFQDTGSSELYVKRELPATGNQRPFPLHLFGRPGNNVLYKEVCKMCDNNIWNDDDQSSSNPVIDTDLNRVVNDQGYTIYNITMTLNLDDLSSQQLVYPGQTGQLSCFDSNDRGFRFISSFQRGELETNSKHPYTFFFTNKEEALDIRYEDSAVTGGPLKVTYDPSANTLTYQYELVESMFACRPEFYTPSVQCYYKPHMSNQMFSSQRELLSNHDGSRNLEEIPLKIPLSQDRLLSSSRSIDPRLGFVVNNSEIQFDVTNS